jgi:transposase
VYLRHTTVRKKGKTHTYWNLVRSVRQGSRVRQEVVARLGKLDARGRAKAKALSDRITGRRTHPSLFEPVESTTDESVEVRLKDVRLERSRRFGHVFLGWTLWRSLRLDELFAELIPPGREEIPWSTLAAVLVICRLCEPSSELHIAEDLYRRTALDDLLGLPSEKVNDDRLYRSLDRILPHKEAVEKHLKGRLGELFDIRYDLLLYDVTSTYFEGLAQRNPQAKRGYSRDHRPDCKQVCIALVVTREGIPLSYEVFDGNRVDVTTVEEIVSAVEDRFGAADRIWVMDRGMVSEPNLEWLRAGKRRYLIGASKSELRHFEAQIVDKRNWNRIREDVEVKLCTGPDGEETFILCRSKSRKAKDKAIVERFAKRLEEKLDSLRRRLERAKKPAGRSQVERQIGRMLAKNSRAAGKYQVQVEETDQCPSGLRLLVQKNAAWSEWAEQIEGCYLLRSNVKDWTDEELWRTYIQLTEAEAAFRIEKTELSIRPIWHQREDRVQAHLFVCFLAYVLWKTLEQWQSRAGLGNSPRTVLEELAQIQSADVVLPTVDRRELRVRCIVRPGSSQTLILERLGIQLPTRLRIPKGVQDAGIVVTTSGPS